MSGERIGRLREERGWSQRELAEKAGVSRHLIGALESGRHTPAVDAALRLAGVLGTTVEALFAPAADEVEAVPVLAGAPSSGPAVVDRVGATQVYAVVDPATGLDAWASADAVADRGRLRMLHPVEQDAFVVLGCDPAVGLAAAMLRARGHAVVAVHGSSAQAIEALEAGRAHAACVHGPADSLSRPVASAVGWRLGSWQVGLAAPDDHSPVALEDVAAGRMPLVRREASTSSQLSLERALARLGSLDASGGTVAAGHLDAARQAAAGHGAAVTMTAAAAAFALPFTPIEEHQVAL
jgi:DNA-binding XRE family transcriptional regulator